MGILTGSRKWFEQGMIMLIIDLMNLDAYVISTGIQGRIITCYLHYVCILMVQIRIEHGNDIFQLKKYKEPFFLKEYDRDDLHFKILIFSY